MKTSTCFIFLALFGATIARIAAPYYGSNRQQSPQPEDNSEDPETRIQNGRAVQQAPSYIAALARDGTDSYCTASLISPNRVLTAAHCLDPPAAGQVIMGIVDVRYRSRMRQQNNPNMTIIDFSASDVVIHPDWNEKAMTGDVAIIKLPTPATKGTPITLAQDDSAHRENLLGIGWGMKDCFSSGSDNLREADAKYVEPQECSKLWGGEKKDYELCAMMYKRGNELAAVAPGDSGGPLVSQSGSSPVQIGVASYVSTRQPWIQGFYTCVNNKIPQVYARVSSFVDFIKENAPDAQFA